MRAPLRCTRQLRRFGSSVSQLQKLPKSIKTHFFVLNNSTKDIRITPDISPERGSKNAHKTKQLYPLTTFLDPNKFYPEVEITDPSIEKLAMNRTFDPEKSWELVCHNNTSNLIRVGSIVEFITGNSEVRLGVVIRTPASQFHHFHNRMVVLAMNNELSRVFPQDITFIANQVFDADWIDSLDILRNRFNEIFEPRVKLVQLVHYFLASAREFQPLLEALMPQVYSHVASKNGPCSVTLLKLVNIIEIIQKVEHSSYLHQCAFLMAIHTHLCADFKHWIVPGCIPLERCTNLVSSMCSNQLPFTTLYFSTPISVMSYAERFMVFDDSKLKRFDDLIAEIKATNPSYDDLVILFTIWKGKEFLPLLQMIKYGVIYPHLQLLKKLSRCASFVDAQITQESLYDFLIALGLYENPQNLLTDPILSSNILGELDTKLLAASSVRDLKPSSIHLASRSESYSYNDKFHHLRKRQYFSDHVVYIIPGTQGSLAVSIEKSNTRRYLINIHVLDPTTKISPSSNAFKEWAQSSSLFVNWSFYIPEENSLVFPQEVFKLMAFEKANTVKQPDYYRVGDINRAEQKTNVSTRYQSCMTVTLEYNPASGEPLKDLGEQVSISFDDISKSQIKSLDVESLESSLLGLSSPSLLNTFKLFNRAKATNQSDSDLGDEDHQNLNFIHSFLKIHLKLRNRSDATAIRPKGFKSLVQKIAKYNPLDDTIDTMLEIGENYYNDMASFFRSEVNVVLGALTASFCKLRSIPVIFRNQSILDTSEDLGRDGVIIKHKNAFFPAFTARSYFQAAFARDVSGYVSPPASIFAFSHLGKTFLEAGSTGQSISLGLPQGFVNISDPTATMESYLNQLQILAYIHSTSVQDTTLVAKMAKFSHLKALGYNLHGPMSASVLNSYVSDLEYAGLAANYFLRKISKYWLLKALQHNPTLFSKFTCVVTRVHEDSDIVSNFNLSSLSDFELRHTVYVAVSALCTALQTEVVVLIPANTECTIGTEITASEIVLIDAISGYLLLK